MSTAVPNVTPLLDAFRTRRTPSAQVADAKEIRATGFESLLTLLACLIPVAVCLYLVDIQPLFAIRDVEFTQPDVVVILLVLVVMGRALFVGFHPLRKDFFLPLFLFLVATVISALNASDGLRAAASVVQIVEFGLIAWCFSLIRTPRNFYAIIYVTFGIFIVETVIAAFQFAAGATMPLGTFVGHQQFAFYTSFSAAIALALVLSDKEKVRRAWYSIVLAVLLFGSLLGQERAPWLAFVFAGIAVAVYSGKNRKKYLTGFLITVVIGATLVVAIPQLRDVTISRFAEAKNDTEQSNSLLSRMAVWGVAYKFFVEHPILGVGPKNFQTLLPHYLTFDEMMGSETLDPHNVWLGALAETGIVGFVTYVFLCVAILRLGTKPLAMDLPPRIRTLCLAYVAYHIFWFTMSYHYFSKGSGHIHFMMIGLMLGSSTGIRANRASLESPSFLRLSRAGLPHRSADYR